MTRWLGIVALCLLPYSSYAAIVYESTMGYDGGMLSIDYNTYRGVKWSAAQTTTFTSATLWAMPNTTGDYPDYEWPSYAYTVIEVWKADGDNLGDNVCTSDNVLTRRDGISGFVYSDFAATYTFPTQCRLSLAYTYYITVRNVYDHTYATVSINTTENDSETFTAQEKRSRTWTSAGVSSGGYTERRLSIQLDDSELDNVEGTVDLLQPCSVPYGGRETCSTATTTYATTTVALTTAGAATLWIQTRSLDGLTTYDSVSYSTNDAETTQLDEILAVSGNYIVSACLIPYGTVSFDYGGSNCAVAYVGNGTGTSTLEDLMNELGVYVETPTKESVWDTYGCGDIGITDVKLGVTCAGIFLFYPSESSLSAFTVALDKVMRIYPIGYGYLLYEEFASSSNSTSTAYFDREVVLAEWFGREGGTTTIATTELLSVANEMDAPIFDYMDYLIWFGFFGWLTVWGTTRKL